MQTPVMSFEDDKVHWKHAARRILNLQQSCGGSLVTNLNVILDELNSLDYATNVIENKEVRVLCCYKYFIYYNLMACYMLTNKRRSDFTIAGHSESIGYEKPRSAVP